ncbi:hypothetical protein, partial [Pseudomonas aeruginosa]|uniref:hypothetical protein n=1 Tax=Pseudomonas aeruginosa TaxID=287 RepID=UPI0025B4907E
PPNPDILLCVVGAFFLITHLPSGGGATGRRLKAAPGRRPARRSASLAGIGLPESLLKRFFNVTHELIISLLIIIRKTKP